MHACTYKVPTRTELVQLARNAYLAQGWIQGGEAWGSQDPPLEFLTIILFYITPGVAVIVNLDIFIVKKFCGCHKPRKLDMQN